MTPTLGPSAARPPRPGRVSAPARRAVRAAERGDALVETALVTPLLLVLALGLVGVARVTQAQMGVAAVARETARAGALAATASDALARASARCREVAEGYGLTNGTLQCTVEPGGLARGGQVRAAARYEVALGALPLMGWVRVPVASSQVEIVDPFRSRGAGGGR